MTSSGLRRVVPARHLAANAPALERLELTSASPDLHARAGVEACGDHGAAVGDILHGDQWSIDGRRCRALWQLATRGARRGTGPHPAVENRALRLREFRERPPIAPRHRHEDHPEADGDGHRHDRAADSGARSPAARCQRAQERPRAERDDHQRDEREAGWRYSDSQRSGRDGSMRVWTSASP